MEKEEIIQVAKEFKTPFFLYDAVVVIKQITKLRSSIFHSARIFYSMKANPLIGMCQLMKQEGCGIEVASRGDQL